MKNVLLPLMLIAVMPKAAGLERLSDSDLSEQGAAGLMLEVQSEHERRVNTNLELITDPAIRTGNTTEEIPEVPVSREPRQSLDTRYGRIIADTPPPDIQVQAEDRGHLSMDLKQTIPQFEAQALKTAPDAPADRGTFTGIGIQIQTSTTLTFKP